MSIRIRQILPFLLIFTGLRFEASTHRVTSTQELPVSLVRVIGYQIGSNVQGYFQLVVNGPPNLAHVEIRFNDTLVYETTASQCIWNFYTGDYPLGWTNMTVTG